MNLKGSKSEKNILTALTGEAIARNKYSFYAQKALEEGRFDIAELFEKMANSEKEHGKIWYKLIYGEIKDSKTNLMESAKDENAEWKNIYPKFAEEATEEGFEELAIMFERIASIEADHERKFMEAFLTLDNKTIMDQDEVIKKSKDKEYCCVFCGYLCVEKLGLCPTCSAKDSFF